MTLIINQPHGAIHSKANPLILWPVLFMLLLAASCEIKPETLYTRVAAEDSGIHFNNRIVEDDSLNILTNEYIFNGGGVGIADFNNDDKPDILFTGNQVSNKLYLNQGLLKFTDVSNIAGIEAAAHWSTGVALADVNNDGWTDIYICNAMHADKTKRANLLFIHQGLNENGVPLFKESAGEFGVDDSSNSMGAAFLDYDRDGLLDLYVLNNEQVHTLPTNYRKKINDGSAASNDRLYHNNGDGSFTDVTLQAGIVYEGFGLGIAVADINYDGWPDIHISNDYLTNDLLYINNADGTFTNAIGDFIKHQSKFSMGSDVADYDNDGYLDIVTLDMLGESSYRMKTTIGHNNYIEYVLNERWDYEYQYMRNMLHRGNGNDIPFSEVGLMAGIAKTDWSWAPLFMDADNDGFRDLLITNGFPRDITDKDFGDFRVSVAPFLNPSKILDSIPVVKIPNYAYRNKGDLTFEDSGQPWGLNIPSFSNGAAYADLDADGDLEYVVNNINDKAFVFENNTDKTLKNKYLRVKLKGPQGNAMGIGAKIVLRYEENAFQYQENYLTRGYMSSVEPVIHFGIGAKEEVQSLEILWPDGFYQKLGQPALNKTHVIEYDKASMADSSDLAFPLLPKKPETIFKEVSNTLGVDFVHKEKDFVDYSIQRIVPHKFSQNGPCLALGDMNGDGFEDFIVGSSSGFSPVLYFQDAKGRFTPRELFLKGDGNLEYEEEGMVLFDLENDGDLDLYLVSGSNEFDPDSAFYADRLLVNDGQGNFEVAADKLDWVVASGSVVTAKDFDGDGFTDLFVGGRTPFGKYPMPERSFLLKNEGGALKDVTEALAPDLRNIGMVTDASWSDVDGDQKTDLLVVGELMAVTVFKNTGQSLEKLTNTGMSQYLGWWESIFPHDIDRDGDTDFLLGNMGQNNFYQPSEARPVTVKAKDFDRNGSIDPLSFAYFKSPDGDFTSYPVHFWGDINNQNRLFRSKYNFFKEYANATESSLLSDEELQGVFELNGNYDKSSLAKNNGDGTFKLFPLPLQAQIAPLNDWTVVPADDGGASYVLGIGNDFGNEIFIGRYDALNGIVMTDDGKGGFKVIPADKSGFVVSGDAKSIERLESAMGGYYYLVTQNQGKLLIFKQ